MASNPAFMDAAGQYAEEMKDEIVAEAKAAGDSLDDRSASELDDEDNEDGEDDLEDDEGACRDVHLFGSSSGLPRRPTPVD